MIDFNQSCGRKNLDSHKGIQSLILDDFKEFEVFEMKTNL